MKRMTYFVMALALVLGLAQCKKEQMPANNENEGVRITLNVNGGNNGSKVIVDPNAPQGYATVTFESGDIIYVGNNGAYVGYLTYDGTNFSGSIDDSNLNEADYLHFYFMGNKGTTSQPTEAVSITDQTSKYPVISYAHSKTLYNSEVSTYTAKLQNYCAIVKFTTNNIPVETDITVKGMQNTVSVNFGANNAAAATPTLGVNPYTPGNSGTGDIILHAESPTERWAILLEQDAVNGATVTASGYSNSTCNVPGIANNTYHSTGVSISMTPTPTETTITWTSSIVNTINVPGNGSSFNNNDGITVTSSSSNAQWKWNNSDGFSTITLKSTSDKLTFSTADGTITKIIITLNPTSGRVLGTPSSGWSYVGLPDHTLTWTGSLSSVDLGCVSSKAGPGGFGGGGIGVETSFEVSAITNVEFTVQQ